MLGCWLALALALNPEHASPQSSGTWLSKLGHPNSQLILAAPLARGLQARSSLSTSQYYMCYLQVAESSDLMAMLALVKCSFFFC